MFDRRIYLYGFDSLRKLVDVKFLVGDDITVSEIQNKISFMRMKRPDITQIVICDGTRNMYRAYKELLREHTFTMDIEFWNYAEQNGITVYKK